MSLSFWERSQAISHQDLIVVGSGITGIQAAIAAKIQHPNWKITVLERGPFPSGASTKNAGFACIGSLSEIAEDISSMGEDNTFGLMERRYRGLQILREQVGDQNLDYHHCGGIELFLESDQDLYQSSCNIAEQVNEAILQFSGVQQAFTQSENHYGFNSIKKCWHSSIEGQIDPGKMMNCLLSQAKELGVNIRTGIEVEKIESGRNQVNLLTKFLGAVSASQIIIATNGFAKSLLPDLKVRPVRNQVLITAEIPGLNWSGVFHYDRGYTYFRNVGKRILIGGFRNLGGEAEETDQFGVTDMLQDQLESFLNSVILPDNKEEITHRWSGILGVGESKETIVEEVLPNVFVVVRLGGMGVALGSLLGQEIASQLG